MRKGLITVGVVLGCAFAFPAYADWCTEPSEPSCLAYGDIDDFCRNEVDEYIRQPKAHAECVSEDDRKKINAAIEKWNCRVKGHDTCF